MDWQYLRQYIVFAAIVVLLFAFTFILGDNVTWGEIPVRPEYMSCNAHYAGCVPNSRMVSCSDFWPNRVRVIGHDVYGLDADEDGITCD